MNEQNEIVKQIMLEEVITKAIQVPGVKVNRKEFLAEQFCNKTDILNEIIEKGPIAAGITERDIIVLSKKLILTRTSQSSIASFITGIPGGLALAATIPADIIQFFAMALRLAQELSYLYGSEDLWINGEVDSNKVKTQLILYCGTMFGVSGAVSGVRVISAQMSKTALKKIPQKALTKTVWYPILKKICNLIGVHLTKQTLAKGVSKAVPIVGGVVSGGINFASMLPMANKLNDALYKTVYNYTEAEFNEDIETIMTIDGTVDEEEHEKFSERLTRTLNSATTGISNIMSKITKQKEVEKDPYEEIKKLKDLLDNDIITQEEFDKKKKELLNL